MFSTHIQCKCQWVCTRVWPAEGRNAHVGVGCNQWAQSHWRACVLLESSVILFLMFPFVTFMSASNLQTSNGFLSWPSMLPSPEGSLPSPPRLDGVWTAHHVSSCRDGGLAALCPAVGHLGIFARWSGWSQTQQALEHKPRQTLFLNKVVYG